MKAIEPLPRGLPTPTVAALARVARSTLHHWIKLGLCGPTLVPATGKRATAYWTVRDVVEARAVSALRRAGCPLKTVARVKDVLAEEWDMTLANAVLIWDGRDVLTVDATGEVISLIRERGQTLVWQTVVHVATAPLGLWYSEVDEAAKEVRAAEIIGRRRAAIAQRDEPDGRTVLNA